MDLTTLGGQSGEAGPWYFSLLDNLRRQLGLADPSAFWEGRARGTPVQAFVDYIKEEVAGRLQAGERAGARLRLRDHRRGRVDSL